MEIRISVLLVLAFVLLSQSGAAFPPGTDPTWSAEIDMDDWHFGQSVSTAGDVNGDGFGDVIVGAQPRSSPHYQGWIYVYHGGPAGLPATPSWTTGLRVVSSSNGYYVSVSTAGDVNGDGYDDVIAGADRVDEVRVWYGGPTGLRTDPPGPMIPADWTAQGPALSSFGCSVSTAGDVNGDGFDDVIVGASSFTGPDGQNREGAAFLWYGGPDGLPLLSQGSNVAAPADRVIEGGHPNSNLRVGLGHSVASAGNLDGDVNPITGLPCDDVVIGHPGYHIPGVGDVGRVVVHFGSPAGMAADASAWTVIGDSAMSRFGVSVAGAGDVNGDGFDEILVGAPYQNDGGGALGRVTVFHGGLAGISDLIPPLEIDGDQIMGGHGCSVAGAGDVNDDGFDDIVVGADEYDTGQGGGFDQGCVRVYLGSAAGLGTVAPWTALGSQEDGRFGASVSMTGSVVGNGWDGIIVGAPYWSDPGTFNEEGWAFAYYNPVLRPTLASPPEQRKLDGVTAIPWGGATNEPGFVIWTQVDDPQGLPVRLEAQVGAIGIAFSEDPSNFISGDFADAGSMYSVAISGLVDGAGYRWRVRAVNAAGMKSRWVCFGSDPDDPSEVDLSIPPNQAPTVAALEQVVAPTGAVIPLGAKLLDDVTIRFQATVTDADQNPALLEVEVRPIGTPFSNVPDISGSMTAGTGQAQAVIRLSAGDYHVQARARDSWGAAGPWVSLGGNSEAAPDLRILAAGSANSGPIGCGQRSAGRQPSCLAWVTIALALLFRRGCGSWSR